MDLKEIRKLTRFAQKNGLKRIKTADFEIEFNGSTFQEVFKQNPVVSKKILSTIQKDIPIGGLPTEDDMLYWSADENHLESEKEERPHGL